MSIYKIKYTCFTASYEPMENKFLFIFLFSFLIYSSSFAQADKDLVEAADESYKTGARLLALDQYELALRANPNNIRAVFMAGRCILETKDKGRATQYLLKAYKMDLNVDKEILYLIAQSYQYGKEFDKAIDYYQQYKSQLAAQGVKTLKGKKKGTSGDQISDIDRRIEQCNNGKKYIADPLNYSIKNLGENINTEYPDYAPAINKDENLLIFTSRRQGGVGQDNVDNDLFYFEDIYFSELKDSKWAPAENIGKGINTEFHDASIGLSANGKELFLYKSEIGGGDILVSKRKDDGSWSKAVSIGKNINSAYNENSVALSPDGKTLFFTSDRPGGKGGIDIYMSKMEKGGQWGKPKNLEAPINTTLNDDGPFIDYDNKTLYFSSQAHKGMGGYDVFVSEFDSVKKKWSEPINIGYPINTPDDDVFFVKSGDSKYGYYASVKDGGFGETDIYKVLIPEPIQGYKKLKIRELQGPPAIPDIVVTKDNIQEKLYPVNLTINVKEAKTEAPLDAMIILKNKEDNVEMGVKRTSQGVYTVTFRAPSETNYTISIERDGSMFKNEEILIPGMGLKEENIIKNYELSKIEVGFSSVLRNIYFDFDKATFKTESFNELSKLLRLLQENSTTVVEISGHTDSKGSHDYNIELSQRRANAVVDWLVKKGIDRSRLSAKGFGETKPLATNDDEVEGREINRRTEFAVMGNTTK